MAQVLQKFSNHTVFITGGSSGIGFACAQLLYPFARFIVLFGRSTTKLEHAQRTLRLQNSSHPATVLCIAMDVRDQKQVSRQIEEAIKTAGIPQLLIQSAGYAYPAYFESFPADKFSEIFDVNYFGIWNVLQILLPKMQYGSSVVNISSFAGLLGIIGYSAYTSAKYAVIGLSETLRHEYRPHGIAIKVLCPSDTDTPQLHYENQFKPPETAALAGNIKAVRADFVAKCLLRAVFRKRFLIIPGVYPKIIWFLKRCMPRLIYAIIDSDLIKYQKRIQNRP